MCLERPESKIEGGGFSVGWCVWIASGVLEVSLGGGRANDVLGIKNGDVVWVFRKSSPGKCTEAHRNAS